MKITTWLRQNKMCNADLARSLSCSEGHITRVFNGERQWTWPYINAIVPLTKGKVTLKDLNRKLYNEIQTYNKLMEEYNGE
jgi:hypothetical protein